MFDFLDSNNIGKAYKDFVLLSIEDLPDYKTKAVYLRHKRTGLEVYHILAEDRENTFAFAFRTLAKNSKGCAHIMEHSVLCGSEKYPLKEPFSTLVSQSLNTFLNALTYPDKTVYPAASVVPSDYFTMMDVYADAVFFPKLDYATFMQEGHRVEMDKDGNLSLQGVVYNEMKGNYSAFIDIAIDQQINAMYPNSFASFDSGGDPLEIPSLTYEEFLDFHQKFYSPDNCLLYLYGNIPTEKQLDYFDEKFISRIEKKYGTLDASSIDVYSKLPIVKPEIKELQKLNRVEESQEIKCYAPKTGATGSVVCLNWYSGEANIEKLFLSEVLCGNDSSPLSRILKDSKLGDDLSPIWNNFGQMQEEFFCYGLSGVKKGNEQKVYELVENAIKKVYDDGIKQEDIDSAIMGIDFNLREVTRYWGPYSLVIMEKVLKGWNYGKSCSKNLNPISAFEEVKTKARTDKDFIRKLIKKYFLDNKLCVKITVEPSKSYLSDRRKKENQLLKTLEKSIDKEQLKTDLEKLHAYQQHIETSEEIKCIPHTKIEELDKNIDLPETRLQFVEGADGVKIPLFVNKENTNGIFYLDVMFPFDRLEPKYYEHIPLLTTILTNIGWNNKKWDQCIAQTSCVMGDVWGRTCYGNVTDVPKCWEYAEQFKEYNFIGRKWIGLTCKALTSMATESLDIFAEIISTMDFKDKEHFRTILQEIKADKKESIISGARDYALKRARATFSENYALSEIMWGLSQLYTVADYKAKQASAILANLEKMYWDCYNAGGIIHITADEESLNKIIPLFEEFARKAGIKQLLPPKEYSFEDILPFVRSVENLKDNHSKELIKVQAQTGYLAIATKAAKYMTREEAADKVFTTWLSNHTLWDKIRTTGGAYGAGIWTDNAEETCIMHTYRDPNPLQSMEIYKASIKEIAETIFEKDDVERTIVSLYGTAICPASPKDRGAASFEGMLYANPQEFRLIRIENLLSTTPEDVIKAAKRLCDFSDEIFKAVVFSDKSDDFASNILEIPL
ncbi:MAG: insulinase family protein [Treponema sp.]|nr:insulinase family protein [Treponema sp.]